MKKLVVFSAAFFLLACGEGGKAVSSTSPTTEVLASDNSPQIDAPPSTTQILTIDLDNPSRSLNGADLTGKLLEIQLHPLNSTNNAKTYTLFENIESTSLPSASFPSWCTGKLKYVGKKLVAEIKPKEFTPPKIPEHHTDSDDFIIGQGSLLLRLLALNDMSRNQAPFGANASASKFSQHHLTSGYVSYNLCFDIHLISAVHKFRDTFYTSLTAVKSFNYDALQLKIGGTKDKYNGYIYQSFILKKSGYAFALSSLIGKVSAATFSFQIDL